MHVCMYCYGMVCALRWECLLCMCLLYVCCVCSVWISVMCVGYECVYDMYARMLCMLWVYGCHVYKLYNISMRVCMYVMSYVGFAYVCMCVRYAMYVCYGRYVGYVCYVCCTCMLCMYGTDVCM